MLLRKIRRVGSSTVVSIPSHLLSCYDIKDGDEIQFLVINDKIIGIQKYMGKDIS